MLVIFSIFSLLIVLFVLIPLAKIVFLSNKEALLQALLDPTTIKSILLTLYAALITAGIGFVLGVPLAYLLARNNFPLKGIVEGLIDLPIVYGMTIANNAKNKDAAVKFMQFVLGPEGQRIFNDNHQPELVPPQCDNINALPDALKPFFH